MSFKNHLFAQQKIDTCVYLVTQIVLQNIAVFGGNCETVWELLSHDTCSHSYIPILLVWYTS